MIDDEIGIGAPFKLCRNVVRDGTVSLPLRAFRHVTTNLAKLKLSESWFAGFVDSAEGPLVLLVIR